MRNPYATPAFPISEQTQRQLSRPSSRMGGLAMAEPTKKAWDKPSEEKPLTVHDKPKQKFLDKAHMYCQNELFVLGASQ